MRPLPMPDGDISIGRGQHLRDRIAASRERDLAADLADRLLHQFRFRHQLAEVDSANGDVGVRADRRFARVHADVRADVSVGHAEVERDQLQQPAIVLEVRVHVVERQLRRVDAVRLPADVGIHRTEFFEVVRRIGQHPAARALARRFGGQRRIGRFTGLRLGRLADEDGEVVEIQPLRHQFAHAGPDACLPSPGSRCRTGRCRRPCR